MLHPILFSGASIVDGMDTLYIMGLMDRYEKGMHPDRAHCIPLPEGFLCFSSKVGRTLFELQ